jgi:hypothetical protein
MKAVVQSNWRKTMDLTNEAAVGGSEATSIAVAPAPAGETPLGAREAARNLASWRQSRDKQQSRPPASGERGDRDDPSPAPAQEAADAAAAGEGEAPVDEPASAERDNGPLAVEPPSTWSEQDKELFASLPRAAQERLAERERSREGVPAERPKMLEAEHALLDQAPCSTFFDVSLLGNLRRLVGLLVGLPLVSASLRGLPGRGSSRSRRRSRSCGRWRGLRTRASSAALRDIGLLGDALRLIVRLVRGSGSEAASSGSDDSGAGRSSARTGSGSRGQSCSASRDAADGRRSVPDGSPGEIPLSGRSRCLGQSHFKNLSLRGSQELRHHEIGRLHVREGGNDARLPRLEDREAAQRITFQRSYPGLRAPRGAVRPTSPGKGRCRSALAFLDRCSPESGLSSAPRQTTRWATTADTGPWLDRMISDGAPSGEYASSSSVTEFPPWHTASNMQTNTSLPDVSKTRRGYMARHWDGELSLPLSFWINGLLLSVLVDIAVSQLAFAYRFTGPPTVGVWIGIWALIAFTTLVTIWQLVGIWRSSYKYSGGRPRLWSRLARLAAILGWMKWFRTTWTLILISGGSV